MRGKRIPRITDVLTDFPEDVKRLQIEQRLEDYMANVERAKRLSPYTGSSGGPTTDFLDEGRMDAYYDPKEDPDAEPMPDPFWSARMLFFDYDPLQLTPRSRLVFLRLLPMQGTLASGLEVAGHEKLPRVSGDILNLGWLAAQREPELLTAFANQWRIVFPRYCAEWLDLPNIFPDGGTTMRCGFASYTDIDAIFWDDEPVKIERKPLLSWAS